MKNLIRGTLLLALAGILAACQVSVTLDPFLGAETVSASSNPVVRDDGTLSAGQSAYYRVSVSSDLGGDMVVFEAANGNNDTPVTIKVFNSSQQLLVESNNPDFFASDLNNIRSLSQQSIVTTQTCVGPCAQVAKRASTTTYLVQITADAGSNVVDYDLYAYTRDFTDTNENESTCFDFSAEARNLEGQQGIVTTPPAGGISEVGAIELVSDSDCYDSGAYQVREVTVDSVGDNTAVSFNVVITFDDGSSVSGTVAPGGSFNQGPWADAEDVQITITSANGAAAPSAHSRYRVTIE